MFDVNCTKKEITVISKLPTMLGWNLTVKAEKEEYDRYIEKTQNSKQTLREETGDI